MVASYNDIFNPIEGKKEQLIELFAKLYGKKYREKVTTRINNIEFIFIDNRSEPGFKINQFYSNKEEEIEKQFYNEVKLEGFTYVRTLLEDVRDCLKNKEYNDYYLRKFVKQMGFKGQSEDVLQQEDNRKLVLDKLNQLEEVWNSNYKDRYDKLEEERKKYFKIFEDEGSRRIKIFAEYNDNRTNYMRNNMNISLSNEDDMIPLANTIRDLHSIGKERLNDEFVVSKNKHRFISAFKCFGYDYGDDYDRYINDQNLMNRIFDKGLVDYFYEQQKQMEINLLRNNSQFMTAVKQVEQLDIKGGNWDYIRGIFNFSKGAKGNVGAYCTSYVNNKNELKHIIVCPLGVSLDTETVIHEVGHAICSNIISVDDDGFTYKSGYITVIKKFDYEDFNEDKFFDALTTDTKQNCKNWIDSIDDVKLCNEAFHDFSMKVVAFKAEREGLTIGLKDRNCPTYYEYAFPMIEDFVSKNIKLIKYSQIDEDPMMLAKHIGMDNFEKLSKAIHDCIKYLSMYSNEINAEYNSKVGDRQVTPFEMAHLEMDWSPEARKWLDTYLEAEEVFNSYYQSQQVSQ